MKHVINDFLGASALFSAAGLFAHTPPLQLRSGCGVTAAIPGAASAN